MAELIGIHAWFSQRLGSTSCVANPCLSIGDQIRLVERNTSETYTHLIRSIDSSLDLDSGNYTMQIETHWLGDADNWVIVTDEDQSQFPYIVISERLSSWQSETQRGVEVTGYSLPQRVELKKNGFQTSSMLVTDNFLFSADLEVSSRVDVRLKVNTLSYPLTGPTNTLRLKYNGNVIGSYALPSQGGELDLGSLGVNGSVRDYEIEVVGTPRSKGNGFFSISVVGNQDYSSTVVDTVIIVEPSEIPEEE